MTTVVIDNNCSQATNLLNYISTFPFVRVVEENAKATTFERIPGLAYTQEQRLASIHKSEEELRMGLGISSEQLEKEIALW